MVAGRHWIRGGGRVSPELRADLYGAACLSITVLTVGAVCWLSYEYGGAIFTRLATLLGSVLV